jgi:peroxiredoxin
MPKPAHLKFTDPAPDLDLQDVNYNPVELSSLWKKQVLILAFTCRPPCKEIMDRLVAASPEINGLDSNLQQNACIK